MTKRSDDGEYVEILIQLPNWAAAWYMTIAELHHDRAENTAASVLCDVAEADMQAHLEPMPGFVTLQ